MVEMPEFIDVFKTMETLEKKVGQGGFVRIVDALPRLIDKNGIGPDAAIVQAARVSYGIGTKTRSKDKDLIRYLYRNKHMSPFEMVELKFHVRAQVFTARQWERHRTASYNEESARYSEIATDFYIPEKDRLKFQSKDNKQGSEKDSITEFQDPDLDPRNKFLDALKKSYDYAHKAYKTGLKLGLAREIVRIVLPVGVYTTYYWKVNLRNLFWFLEQRLNEHAQDEIRSYAQAIFSLVESYAPVATQAFVDYQLNSISLSRPEQISLSKREVAEGLNDRELRDLDKKMKSLNLPPFEHFE